jgi:hypothetical protein
MTARVRSLGLVVALASLLAGCATTDVRALQPEEQKRVAEALGPLLVAAYGSDAVRCRVATGVREAPELEAWTWTDPDGPCDLHVVLTARTVAALTPRALQLLLAHELGHVLSQHALGRARQTEIQGARSDSGRRSVLRTSGQQFTPDEEAAADLEAARLLTELWRGSNVGCLGLADLYEGVARDRAAWAGWLSRHPFPERRVEAVVKLCESEQRRR